MVYLKTRIFQIDNEIVINYKDMSTCLGLFYTYRLVNCVHCTFLFAFFFVLLFIISYFCTLLSNTMEVSWCNG